MVDTSGARRMSGGGEKTGASSDVKEKSDGGLGVYA